MTIGRARSILSLIWVCAVVPIFIVLTTQSMFGKYGDEWDLPWNWFIPLVIPILSLIISVWVVDNEFNSDRAIEVMAGYYGALILSIVYLILVYMIVFLESFVQTPIQSIFRHSGWYLGVMQGLIILILHKFFIQNAEPQRRRRNNR